METSPSSSSPSSRCESRQTQKHSPLREPKLLPSSWWMSRASGASLAASAQRPGHSGRLRYGIDESIGARNIRQPVSRNVEASHSMKFKSPA